MNKKCPAFFSGREGDDEERSASRLSTGCTFNKRREIKNLELNIKLLFCFRLHLPTKIKPERKRKKFLDLFGAATRKASSEIISSFLNFLTVFWFLASWPSISFCSIFKYMWMTIKATKLLLFNVLKFRNAGVFFQARI